ncbi:hypothetical protein LIPSTDRAFT_334861 [Lipomyces starkeyi NRRL Y-11557]|uniref:HAT C-terminal dimerisation domain-containing protein n=1 Tax=Lipomyces starkeyi NRRL Y-11557 TaxID=675824 RepID=A0A1E3PUT6_LIPST|nr:hypothetical protein LIPSTDRAFT_334861 [Lipomyces starkeyi NRRL Y-11557]
MKERLTHQQLLEKNILKNDRLQEFQQIFYDIAGIIFTSRQDVRQRLADEFAPQRVQLNEELSKTWKTIAISLDVWTSKNSLPILGMIDYWLTPEFQYQ